jgi:hypothetical protein
MDFDLSVARMDLEPGHAITVVGGTVEVVSEGRWTLLNR